VVVEGVVTGIDEIVHMVRFPSWQSTKAGEREVQKALRKVIYTKYQVKDQDLFDKAFGSIRQYSKSRQWFQILSGLIMTRKRGNAHIASFSFLRERKAVTNSGLARCGTVLPTGCSPAQARSRLWPKSSGLA
jgi:hypothetical protein